MERPFSVFSLAPFGPCRERSSIPALQTATGTGDITRAKVFSGMGAWGKGQFLPKNAPSPAKNKKGRKKENSSGRAAPQGSPALPARLCVGRR